MTIVDSGKRRFWCWRRTLASLVHLASGSLPQLRSRQKSYMSGLRATASRLSILMQSLVFSTPGTNTGKMPMAVLLTILLPSFPRLATRVERKLRSRCWQIRNFTDKTYMRW